MKVSWDLDKYVGAFNFRVSIDGIPQENSKILAVSGVGSESKLVDDDSIGRVPLHGGGQITLSEVEITRVYQGYDQFYNWRMMIEEGEDALRSVSIELLLPDLNTVARKVILHNCWPHKWQLPNLDASSTAPAVETISLAYERMTTQLGGASSGDAYSGEGTAGGAGAIGGREGQIEADYGDEGDGPKIRGNASGEAHWTEWQDALELASGLLDPNEESWDPPSAVDDPTAARNGSDGAGPLSGRGEQDEAEYGEGEGPLSGRGEQDEAEYGDEGESMDPNEETWDGPEGVDDPTAARSAGDGDGPIIRGNASGLEQEFADSTADDGAPIDPNEVTDWGGSAAADDPTAARSAGDGSGPIIRGNASGLEQEFADSGDGTGPIDPNEESWDAIQGEGEQDFRDNDDTKFQGEGEQDFRDNDDTSFQGTPTAFADTGGGKGSIDPNEESWDAPSAVDDPTAARNGGDGSGPIGGRDEPAEADYGTPGDGPKGGRGYTEQE